MLRTENLLERITVEQILRAFSRGVSKQELIEEEQMSFTVGAGA